MLNEHGVEFTYREYTKEPLGADEIRDVLTKLGVGPREILRTRDAKKLDVDPELDGDALIAAMVEHPTLIQRPIAIVGDRAVLGRPYAKVLDVVP